MPNHTYKPGDLVERIFTGERAIFDSTVGDRLLLSIYNAGEGGYRFILWNAADCRPVVENISRCDKCGYEFDTNDDRMRQDGDYGTPGPEYCPACALEEQHAAELAAKDARIAKLEQEAAAYKATIEAMAERLNDVREMCREAGETIGVLDEQGVFEKSYWKLRSFADGIAICDNADDFFDTRDAAEGE